MTDKKPIAPSEASQSPSPGTHTGHLPASEDEESPGATPAAEESDTSLPASETESLASSDVGERILERGLTRLPPG